MKKSEMEKILLEAIYCNTPHGRIVWYRGAMSDILSKLEGAGMSPPPSKEDKWIDAGEEGQGFVSYNHPQWDKEC